VIGVVVDGPMGEDHVGLLGLQQVMELLVMDGVNDRLAVNLPGKGGPRLENFAGFLGFGHAHGAGVMRRLVGPLALIQVEQDDLVPQVGVAGDGAAAAVFGVAGMPTGDDYLELGLSCWRCFAGQRLSGGCRQRQANRHGGSQPTASAQHVAA